MRILVLGGCGFLGSHVVDDLVDRGEEVLVVDDLSSCWLADGDDGQTPRFANPGARYLGPTEITDRAGGAEVVVDLAARHPVEREIVVYQALIGRVTRAAWIASTGATARTLRRYVVASSNEVAAPTLLGGHLRTMREALAYLHRPPTLDVEFVHLPELYGPRQLPDAGDVAAALTGAVAGVAPAFGDLAFVRDAARFLADRALEAKHRRPIDLHAVARPFGVEELRLVLRQIGEDAAGARVVHVPRPEIAYETQLAERDAAVLIDETPLGEGLAETAEFYREVVRAEAEGGGI